IWDYSDLERTSRDTLIYNTVNETPIFYQFQFNNPISPAYLATEALMIEDIDLGGFVTMSNNFLFSKTENSKWSEIGIGTTVSGIPLPTKYTDIKTKLNLPLNYGDQNSDDYSYEITIPAVGVIGQEGTLNYVVDGWGTLITPGGTFQTLRVKTTTVGSDTIYLNLLSFGLRIPSTEIIYEWYAPNKGFPVLTVTEQLGVISSTVYLDDPTLSVKSLTQIVSNIYPNPANEILNLEFSSSQTRITICDLAGKVMQNHPVGTSQINISSLTKGVYLLKTELNGEVEWHKFIKN
ncbi:MAG: T9SS type A sorting domain-containing protein, partial [Salibacteraceae bacterium]